MCECHFYCRQIYLIQNADIFIYARSNVILNILCFYTEIGVLSIVLSLLQIVIIRDTEKVVSFCHELGVQELFYVWKIVYFVYTGDVIG